MHYSSWSQKYHFHFQVSHIMDPMDDSTFKNIWMATAKVRETEMLYPEVIVHSSLSSNTEYATKLVLETISK